MKDYTTSNPVFSESIKILETTDPGHADNVNITTMQLLQNSLSNRAVINALLSWVYDEDNENVISALPCEYVDETLTIPDGMGSVNVEILELAIS